MLLKGLSAAGTNTRAVCSAAHEFGILPFVVFQLKRGGYGFQKSMEATSYDFSGAGTGACFLGMSPKHHTSGQYLKAPVDLPSRPCVRQPLFAAQTSG